MVELEAETHPDKQAHAPPRVMGLPAVVAITYFCVSGGAYGLEGFFLFFFIHLFILIFKFNLFCYLFFSFYFPHLYFSLFIFLIF